MEPTPINQQATAKKELGNAAFKKGHHSSAVQYYTEAIDIQPHETILSNRAASFIEL